MTLDTDRRDEIVSAVLESHWRIRNAYRAEVLTRQDIIDYVTDDSWYQEPGHGEWLETAPVLEIAEWVDIDALMTTECAYCGAQLDRMGTVPPETDEDWERIAGFHASGCEWVETRAHQWTRTLSASEAAEILGVTRRTIHNYWRDGKFPSAWETPGGQVRIPEAEVQRFKRGATAQTFPADGHVSAVEPDKTVITFILREGEEGPATAGEVRLSITEFPGWKAVAKIQRDGYTAESEDFDSVTEAIAWGRDIQKALAT
jgi:excisionase family DNA binding protein